MEYVNKRFVEMINSTPENQAVIETMKRDVDQFMPEFSDSPDKISRWGHNYFCDDDGGRLIFDLNSPHEHRCEICGKVYKSDLMDGVWVCFYRNRAVVMALVSATIFKATGERKYLDYAVQVIDYYAEHYDQFVLHNKEDEIFDSYETMKWGCGKMMPQGLNESINMIRFVQTIEIIRDELDPEWLDQVYQKMFREVYNLLAPQVRSIHNIACWNLAAIGVIGLAFEDQELIDFAFKSEFNIRQQLEKGVTEDAFWYEGSIHYNFFLLEGISYLVLFSKLYDYDFGARTLEIFENMFVQAYHYGFDNQYLPNPNDGWPNLNLKTFSYVYHTVARAMGEDSAVGNLTKIIEASPEPRTILPLSEPYYTGNKVCLEQLLFNIDFDYDSYTPIAHSSHNFPRSNFVMLRDKAWNVFMKYGLNGKSHAHPDIMTVEVVYDGQRIIRDLSNAGYQSRLCNEWHRKTLAHNTVCFNGTDITSVSPGESLYYDGKKSSAIARDVYEGISYTRTLEIKENVLADEFKVSGAVDGIYDYVFHFEPGIHLICELETEPGSLGFDKNGYQHILDTRKVLCDSRQVELTAQMNGKTFTVQLELEEGQQLYLLKTMDNPVNRTRETILIRSEKADPCYKMEICM